MGIMKTRTNYVKYDNRLTICTADESGKIIQKDEKKVEQQNKIKEVCLKCTKKKCRGSDKCFEKEKDKIAE